MLSQLLADNTFDTAYAWLCKQRMNHPPNADIWHFRRHHSALLSQIKAEIAGNRYLFTPLQVISKQDGSQIAIWSARDALVLKMLTLILQTILPCHTSCKHIKGNGGSKRAVQATHDRINSGQFA